MRVHNRSTLVEFIENNPNARNSLRSWYAVAIKANWQSSNELKEQFRNASIINKKRVVFNIHGNAFRLIVDIEYTFQKIFLVWFGSHEKYDKVEIEKLRYVKTDKK